MLVLPWEVVANIVKLGDVGSGELTTETTYFLFLPSTNGHILLSLMLGSMFSLLNWAMRSEKALTDRQPVLHVLSKNLAWLCVSKANSWYCSFLGDGNGWKK